MIYGTAHRVESQEMSRTFAPFTLYYGDEQQYGTALTHPGAYPGASGTGLGVERVGGIGEPVTLSFPPALSGDGGGNRQAVCSALAAGAGRLSPEIA